MHANCKHSFKNQIPFKWSKSVFCDPAKNTLPKEIAGRTTEILYRDEVSNVSGRKTTSHFIIMNQFHMLTTDSISKQFFFCFPTANKCFGAVNPTDWNQPENMFLNSGHSRHQIVSQRR